MGKKTIFVREIDGYGRIPIPEEIRRNLKIQTGDLFSLEEGSDQSIMIQKYSPLQDSISLARFAADSLAKEIEGSVLIVSCERLLTGYLIGCKESFPAILRGKALSEELKTLLHTPEAVQGFRTNVAVLDEAEFNLRPTEHQEQYLIAIGKEKILGGILIRKEAGTVTSEDLKIFQFTAHLLGTQN